MELNRDKLDYLICIAAARCYDDDAEKLDSVETSSVVFSRSYENKKRRIIRQYKNKDRNIKLKKIALRAAICALLIMSMAFITVMAIESLRDAVFETIIEWYDDYFTIRFKTPTSAPTDNNGTENGKTEAPTEGKAPVITPPVSIEEVRKPTYLPDGVEEDLVVQNKSAVITDYYIGDTLCFSLSQKTVESSDKYINNKENNIKEVSIGNIKGTLITYEDRNDIFLIWTDGEYIYELRTNFADVGELIRIAESIK